MGRKMVIGEVGTLSGGLCKNPNCKKPLVIKHKGKVPQCCNQSCAAQYSHTVRDAVSYKKCWQTYVNKLTALAEKGDVEVPGWLEQEVVQ